MRLKISQRNASFHFAKNGVHLKPSLKERTINIPERSKRGKITRFSRHSARRLKNKLLTLPVESGEVFGITFTIRKTCYKSPDQVRKFWKKFLNAYYYACKTGKLDNNSYFLWRIELQQNKTPHWHCVFIGDILTVSKFVAIYNRCYDRFFNDSHIENITAKIDLLRNFSACFAYVSTHASKHKKSQLGWKGLQWGIVFASSQSKQNYLERLECDKIKFKEERDKNIEHNASYEELYHWQEVLIRRALKRLYYSKFRSNFKSSRSQKLSSFTSMSSFHFVNDQTKTQLAKVINL